MTFTEYWKFERADSAPVPTCICQKRGGIRVAPILRHIRKKYTHTHTHLDVDVARTGLSRSLLSSSIPLFLFTSSYHQTLGNEINSAFL